MPSSTLNKSLLSPVSALIGLTITLLTTGSVFATPDIQQWQTNNGAKVYYVPAPELPIVDISIVFDAGAARDGDKPGLALLTNALLPEGAGDMDANTIAERFDNLGARFSNSSHRDMSVFKIRSLSAPGKLNSAIKILTTILTKPTIPENALNRERNRLLVSLQGSKQSPGNIAEKTFFKAIYGSHPYSTVPNGNEKSVKSISRKDLMAFYSKYFVSRNAVVSIVGDIDRQQAEALAEALTGKLQTGEHAATLPKVSAAEQPITETIDFPSTQTHVIIGQAAMTRNDPDYFALFVGNHILGGSGLNSRISNEVREKRGLSYSAYSYFSPMREQGPFQIGLTTRNEKTSEALEVLNQTFKEFIDKGPSEDELEAAKKNITGGFALRLSSNKKILNYIAVIGFYNLPLDYLDTFNTKVDAVTLKSIKETFKKRLDLDKMVTIIVGGTT